MRLRLLMLAGLAGSMIVSACDCGGGGGSDAGPGGGGGLECGEGTVEKNGECVPEEEQGGGLQCGPGTVANADGTACVPALECPPGTTANAAGTGCDLVCAAPRVYDSASDACVCPDGLAPDGANGCEIDPSTCGEGTAFVDGTCVPVSPPSAADDDVLGQGAVVVTLPGVDDPPVEIGGIVGRPSFTEGADFDVYQIDGTAGTRLLVQVVSFGAADAAFVAVGVADPDVDDNIGLYQRFGAPGANRIAAREIVLPLDGTYQLIVTEWGNFTGSAVPLGSDDATYSILVDVLPPVAPTVIPAGGAAQQGDHDDIDAYRMDTASLAEGALFHARLAAPPADVDPDGDTFQLLWTVADGRYLEFDGGGTGPVDALLAQQAGGTTVHVDYLFRLGLNPSWQYSLTAEAQPILDGPAENAAPVELETGGQQLTLVELALQADHVYRVRLELPTTSTLAADAVLLDQNLQLVESCRFTTLPSGLDGFECRTLIGPGKAGTYFLALVDFSGEDPLTLPNHNFRVTLEGAALADTFTLSLDSVPPVTSDSASLSQPASADPDHWGGPWVLVQVQTLASLEITTDTGVLHNAFDAESFAEASFSTTLTTDNVLPGASLLVQATGGAEAGTFTLAASAADVPFPFEDELNDGPSLANPLAESDPALTAQAGACDVTGVAPITSGGRFETSDWASFADDFNDSTLACGSAAFGENPDAFLLLGPKPGGTTVTVTAIGGGDGIDATLGFQDSCAAATCTGFTNDVDFTGDEVATYTYTGAESGGVILVVDTADGFPSGRMTLDIAFSDEGEDLDAAGLASAGDNDWYTLTADAPGLLTVDLGPGPLGGTPDVAVEIIDSDGSSVLGGPVQVLMSFGQGSGSVSAYVDAAGTYYAHVSHIPEIQTFFGPFPGATGDYTISWRLDRAAEAPPSCEAPGALAPNDFVEGDTSLGSQSSWEPADETCLGFPPAIYAGPNDVYEMTVPAGATLVIDAFASFDVAVAIVDGTCAGACLAGSDADIEEERAVWLNDTGADRDVLVVVDGFGGDTGSYFLSAQLFGSACRIGESRCNGADLETCNFDGTAFEATTCQGGCTFDDFEERASCNVVCDAGTTQCVGNVLTECNFDGTASNDTTCDVACTDDPDLGSLCTFGVCGEPQRGEQGCAVADVTGDGNDDVVETFCNVEASFQVETSCASGECTIDGLQCEPPALPMFTAPAPDSGACALGSAALLTTSGSYTVALAGTLDNDFDPGIDFDQWGGCADDGADVFWVLDARDAVTVTVKLVGADVGSPFMALLQTNGCDAVAASCVGFGFTDDSLTYTFGTGEEDLVVLVDSSSFFGQLGAGDLQLEVTYSDELPTALPICTPDTAVCDGDVLETCDGTGSIRTREYCFGGCTAGACN